VEKLWSHFERVPAALTDRERDAVFSFVKGVRDTPIHISILYQQQRDPSWLKAKPTDQHYESYREEISLFDIANHMGRHYNYLRLGQSRAGTVIAEKILSIDKPAGADAIVTAQVPQPPVRVKINLADILVVSDTPDLLPTAVSAHITDLNLIEGQRASRRHASAQICKP